MTTETQTIQSNAAATLRTRCILVSFSAGYYNWMRRDSSASKELAESKGISKQTYTTFKNIFLGTDKLLGEIKAITQQARLFHTQNTLPSPWAGFNLLPNVQVSNYKKKFLDFQSEMETKLQELQVAWPTMLRDASVALGPAHDPKIYPSIDDVIAGCYLTHKVAPVPDSEGLTLEDLDLDTAQAIKSTISVDLLNAYNDGIAEAHKRLLTLLKSAVENLNKVPGSGGHFRTEWHQNLQEILPLMRSFNVGKDADFERILAATEQLLGEGPDTHKDDLNARALAATKATFIYDQLSGLYGAPLGEGE